jgi:cellulose synthase (UDP-forming)
VLLNLIWTVYNLLILGGAIGVAAETRQVRLSHRVSANLLAALQLSDGTRTRCHTENYSMTGLGLVTQQALDLPVGERVTVSLWLDDAEYSFPALVTFGQGNKISINFEALSLKQETELIQCTFARAEAWNDWTNQQDANRPIQGLKEIASLGLRGYRGLWQQMSTLLTKRGLSLQDMLE